MKQKLYQVLSGVCPRVFPVVADPGVLRPYVTYQRIGGDLSDYLGNDAPPMRHAIVQVNVWADDPAEADQLALDIEAALRAAEEITAKPQGEAQDDHDPDMEVYGARQDFDVWV